MTFFALLAALLILPAGLAEAAPATQTCGPDALGTSRTLVLGTEGGTEVGLKTYPRTVPLADHEVVLSFDDGPGPRRRRSSTPSRANASRRISSSSAAMPRPCRRS